MMVNGDYADASHASVLLHEAVSAVVQVRSGVYLDGTFGRGGHTALLLSNLESGGRLIALDRDPDAISFGLARFSGESRLTLKQRNFSELRSALVEESVPSVDGVLLDLGVSSPQIDQPERGFSFSKNGPLNMRMSKDAGVSASDWLNSAEEQDIARVIFEYGEERFSRRIAREICIRREESPIETTAQLASIVFDAVPRVDPHKHPATRTFQAIRIHVNNELGEVEVGLAEASEMLKVGGRLVVISFHSLEDRLVKRFFRKLSSPRALPKEIPVTEQSTPPYRVVGKAIKASREEVAENPRSRSAVMRILERVA